MTIDAPTVVVVIPTFNERDNLPVLLDDIAGLGVTDLRVLVVDDQSPDGTGELADKLAAEAGGWLSVLHRTERHGLGRAYVDGMAAALDDGADIVIQMDADLSHPASAIPVMLDTLRTTDAAVVIGSRYVEGGSLDTDWPRHRRLLSSWANVYVNGILRLDVRDSTAGFKAWRAQTLRAIDFETVRSNGYSFQVEMNYRTTRLGLPVVEVPIHFVERRRGSSKMTLRTQVESAAMPWRLRRRRPRGRS